MEHRSKPLAIISSQPDHPTPSQQQLRGLAALESSNRRNSNAQISSLMRFFQASSRFSALDDDMLAHRDQVLPLDHV
jgi:hypothetical protein